MPKIVALVKHTPDLASDRSYADDLTVDRDGVDCHLSELDEYTAEQAITLSENVPATEITYLTVGPEDADATLRKALAMGGDRGVHVLDDGLHGSDAMATARTLVAALSRLDYDLVLCGMSSTDGAMGVLPAMLAEHLGLPQVTYAMSLTCDGTTVEAVRDTDEGTEELVCSLPAVVSVTDRTGEARYPSFKGIMAAKKKPVETWTLGDLDLDAATVGAAGSHTAVREAVRRPPRQAGEQVKDEGEGGTVLADYLARHKFI
ncbi:electron transfer flavoprotein subunit beta/FixA family protein [Streptomyces sp. NPDC059373]